MTPIKVLTFITVFKNYLNQIYSKYIASMEAAIYQILETLFLLTSRWGQQHIRVFWVGGNLGDPSWMTQEGSTQL